MTERVDIHNFNDLVQHFRMVKGEVLSVSGNSASLLINGENIDGEIVFNSNSYRCELAYQYYFKQGDDVSVLVSEDMHYVVGHVGGLKPIVPDTLALNTPSGEWVGVELNYDYKTDYESAQIMTYTSELGSYVNLSVGDDEMFYLDFEDGRRKIIASGVGQAQAPDGIYSYMGGLTSRAFVTESVGRCIITQWGTIDLNSGDEYWNGIIEYLCREYTFQKKLGEGSLITISKSYYENEDALPELWVVAPE